MPLACDTKNNTPVKNNCAAFNFETPGVSFGRQQESPLWKWGLPLSAFSICWIASLQVNKYLPVEGPSEMSGMQISECDTYENVEINMFSPCQAHCQTFVPVLH